MLGGELNEVVHALLVLVVDDVLIVLEFRPLGQAVPHAVATIETRWGFGDSVGDLAVVFHLTQGDIADGHDAGLLASCCCVESTRAGGITEIDSIS